VKATRQQARRFALALAGSLKRVDLSAAFAARVLCLLLVVAGAFGAQRAEAHATSTSYLVAQDNGRGEINVTWDVAVADVHWALGLDADGDGNITWREIEARRDDIAALAQSHLTIARGATRATDARGSDDVRGSTDGASTAARASANARGSTSCPTQLTDLSITTHAGEPHLSLAFLATCGHTAAVARNQEIRAATLPAATASADNGERNDSPATHAFAAPADTAALAAPSARARVTPAVDRAVDTQSPHAPIARAAAASGIPSLQSAAARALQEPHATAASPASAKARATDAPLSITANLFFDKDATQRTLLDITTPGGQFTSILSPATPTWSEPKAPSALHTFTTFTAQGLWHVWIGYDHLAFLLLLILPGVLRPQPAADLLRIITAFTVAHSITLALATTGTVHIPVRPIEVAIALSIIIAALLNLFPKAAKARLGLAFGFGLIHGFGFANALAELGTHGTRLIPTLAGFNVGVELAQISLVALVLPFLLRARNSMFYAWRFMPAASLAAALAGAAWVAARVG
jgi:hypothetical protein